MNIKIVEDEIKQQELLESFLRKALTEKNIPYTLEFFHDGESFLEKYQKPTSIVFMDIQLDGKIDGMEVSRRLRRIDEDVILIFVTNMAQFAVQGYEVDATDFIVKPINFYSFNMKLEKALRILARRTPTKQILFKIENKDVSLSSSDILYIEVVNHDLYLYTLNDKFHIHSSMKKAMHELDGLPFSRCHVSYLVNLSCVKSITKNEVILSNGTSLLMSRSRRKEFLADYSAFLGGA